MSVTQSPELPRIAACALFSCGVLLACQPAPVLGPGLDDDLPTPGESFDESCYRCHGNSLSPAPPRGLGGTTATTDMGVGAHRSHLAVTEKSTWHAPVLCESCHVVPAEEQSPGHIDDGDSRAEITFGELARTGGSIPVKNEDGTCSDVYCHGASLTGGSLIAPLWTQVDATQRECGTCHGTPPPAPHPAGDTCGACHPTMEPGNNTAFLDPSRHINGVVEFTGEGSGACDSCHGQDGFAAPPRDLAGNTERSAPGVGAHRAHLGGSTWRREINCSNCHVVPVAVGDSGHIDGDNTAEVPFDNLNPTATVDIPTATCDNLYCHGNGRGNNGTMLWTSTSPMDCASCHITPTVGQNATQLSGAHDKHVRDKRVPCVDCHSGVVDSNTEIINGQLHVNGQRNILILTGGDWNPNTSNCSNMACHGSENWYDD